MIELNQSSARHLRASGERGAGSARPKRAEDTDEEVWTVQRVAGSESNWR